MADPQAEFPGYVLVVCRICKARLHPEVGPQARSVRCPDCETMLRVPSRDDAVAQWERDHTRKPLPDPGTYQLSMAADEPKTEPARGGIVCPHCGLTFSPLLDEKPRTMLCPGCYEPVELPSRSGGPLPPLPKKKKKKKRPRPAAEQVTDSEAAGPRPFEAMAEIRRVEEDPPPRWTFFSEVFEFPWQRGTLLRWVFLSILLLGAALLWTAAGRLYLRSQAEENRFGFIALGFLMLPTIWMTFWSLSYSAACCLPTITETAAGKRRIDSWPDPDWRDWMLELIYTLYQFAVVAAPAFTLGQWAGEAIGLPWIVPAALCIAIYPIVLLSSLEADSPWVPLTWPILRSLVKVAWAWLVFYLLMGALWGSALALAVVGWQMAPYLTAIFAGPALAALLLISSRLLGRLAWRAIVEELPEPERAALAQERRNKPERNSAAPADDIPADSPTPRPATRRKPRPKRAALSTPQSAPTVEPSRPAPPPAPSADEDDYWNFPTLNTM